MATNVKLGELSAFTCPECHGALWEINDGTLLRYRCHVGHAFTGETMLAMQSRQTEDLLYSLLRTHRERAVLAQRMAEQERKQNRIELADQLEQRAKDYKEDAEVIRRLLRVVPDATAGEAIEQDLP